MTATASPITRQIANMLTLNLFSSMGPGLCKVRCMLIFKRRFAHVRRDSCSILSPVVAHRGESPGISETDQNTVHALLQFWGRLAGRVAGNQRPRRAWLRVRDRNGTDWQ